jgi:hypothetical protein
MEQKLTKPLSTDLYKQTLIYLLSFFLAPLGLWPAVKYLREPNKKAKNIGIAAIVLTIISLSLSAYISVKYVGVFSGSIAKQIDLYRTLTP